MVNSVSNFKKFFYKNIKIFKVISFFYVIFIFIYAIFLYDYNKGFLDLIIRLLSTLSIIPLNAKTTYKNEREKMFFKIIEIASLVIMIIGFVLFFVVRFYEYSLLK